MPRYLFFAICAAVGGCAGSTARLAESPARRRLDELQHAMIGDYDNHQQNLADPHFFLVNLHLAPIWTDRSDGPWLYFEQAAADKPDRPFRQRIFQLRSLGPERIEAHVFIFRENALQYAGAWKDPFALSSITPELLRRREGCSLFLTRQPDGSWSGGTSGTGCSSDIRGATYATTEVALFPDALRIWDRGFDHDGRQVWGATVGPYVFQKVSSDSTATQPAPPPS